MEAVVKSVKNYLDSLADLPDEEKPTIAILVPRNQRGVEVIDTLKKCGIETIELISSTSNTRAAAGSLSYLLSYLADPQSTRKLSKAYQVWRRDWREDVSLRGLSRNSGEIPKQSPSSDEEIASPEERHLAMTPTADMSLRGTKQSPNEEGDASLRQAQDAALHRTLLAMTSNLLRKLVDVENFIAPRQDHDWLVTLGESESDAEAVIQELAEFRTHLQRWLNAVTLPIDQLVLTLAQDVFTEASDLALAHKLALVLRQAADDHADWRLPELTSELAVIAKNERRFIGFSSDDSGFDPERHRGRVVVTTMHKAKGLEWDRVYLMSVNNYDFPSNMPNDRFISEKWFVRNSLNLEAEALAQLKALESKSEYDWYEEGAATMRARLDYVKERLRLLFVGITRAKKDLIVTWNSGRQGDAIPSLALSELIGWWGD
jgi:DNA helicase-2/ATP-dependent DNA helicase PcrA